MKDKTILENFDDKTILEENVDKTILEADEEKTLIENSNIQSHQAINNFKNYKIVKEFTASGSEADIFLLDNDLVLKLYRKGITINDEIISKIKKISEKNQNIIKIIDFGFDEKSSRYYEIMEHARYGSVKDFFITTPATKEQIKILVSQINEALKEIHNNSIIHRDLKPTNILVKSINPFIFAMTDFGISSSLDNDATKKFTQVRGTPVYSAPESFSGIIGKEVDYWALGMIILELLHKNPFKGLNQQTIMFKITSESVNISENIDEDIKTLIKGLLTQNRKYRWGYNQVDNWLKGKMEKVYYYYNDNIENKGKYKFFDKSFSNLEDFIKEATKDSENFQKFITFLKRGYVNKQLMDNGETELDILLSEIIEEESNNILLGLRAVKLLAPNITPKIYGIELNALNLLKLFYKYKANTKTSKNEERIIFLFKNNNNLNKLIKYLNDKEVEKTFKIYFHFEKKLPNAKNKDLLALKITTNYINPQNIMPENYLDISQKTIENYLHVFYEPITRSQLKILNYTLEEIGFNPIEEYELRNEMDIESLSFLNDKLKLIPEDIKKEDIKSKLDSIKSMNLDSQIYAFPKEIKILLEENEIELEKLINTAIALIKFSKNKKDLNLLDKKELDHITSIYEKLESKGYLVPFEAKYVMKEKPFLTLDAWNLFIENFVKLKSFYEENKKEIDEIIKDAT